MTDWRKHEDRRAKIQARIRAEARTALVGRTPDLEDRMRATNKVRDGYTWTGGFTRRLPQIVAVVPHVGAWLDRLTDKAEETP